MIHHWSTHPDDKLPWVENFWLLPAVPVFEEDLPVIASLPPPKTKVKVTSDLK